MSARILTKKNVTPLRPALTGILTSLFLLMAATALGIGGAHNVNVTPCSQSGAWVTGNARVVGNVTLGNTITLDAGRVKVTWYPPVGVPGVQGGDCNLRSTAVPNVSWILLSQPAGSTTTIVLTGPRTASLVLDDVGDYVVRMTACPGGCTVPGGTAESKTQDLTITVNGGFVRRPESQPCPTPIASPVRYPSPWDGCTSCCPDWQGCDAYDLGSALKPEWKTFMAEGNGLQLAPLEGEVTRADVSWEDNPFYHTSISGYWGEAHDFTFDVEPDPPFRWVKHDRQLRVECEWEYPSFHSLAWPVYDFAWPAVGDRVSVWGYWVYDCGHYPFAAEIHPPVGVASHRTVPVRIPADSLFNLGGQVSSVGSDVFVPGIRTDMFFSIHGGDLVENCGTGSGLSTSECGLNRPCFPHLSSLSEARVGTNPPSGSDTPGLFTFTILLPLDPSYPYRQAHRQVPDVPLYAAVVNMSAPVPIQIVRNRQADGSTTSLSVTVDFRGTQLTTFDGAIETAWVYPSPWNWGLQEWGVQINRLDVIHTGDCWDTEDPCTGCFHYPCGPEQSSPGDWRFFVNLNNAWAGISSWIELYRCNRCIYRGANTVGNVLGNLRPAPWETGDELGSHVRLFPWESLRLYASGYNEDGGQDHSVGVVSDFIDVSTGTSATGGELSSAYGAFASYRLVYSASRRRYVYPIVWTTAAQSFYDSFFIRTAPSDSIPADIFPPPIEPLPVHPTMVAIPDDSVLAWEEMPMFEPHECEERALPCLPDSLFYGALARAGREAAVNDTVRAQLDTVLVTLRRGFDIDLAANPAQTNANLSVILPSMQDSLPPEFYDRHFGVFGHSPIASAAGPYVVECPSTGPIYVRLDGSASADRDSGTVLRYSWSTSQGHFYDSTTVRPLLIVDQPIAAPVCNIKLTVDDGFFSRGATSKVNIRCWETGEGIPVCTANDAQSMAAVVLADSGGVIAVWADTRDVYGDIYAQRVDAAGATRWTAEGVGVCIEGHVQGTPIMAPDGSGGSLIAWEDLRNGLGGDVYAQRISASGQGQWQAGGVAVTSPSSPEKSDPRLIPDGGGGAILAWRRFVASGNYDVYAQRLDATGGMHWGASGVPVCTATNVQTAQQLVPDGSGGALLVWEDQRFGSPSPKVYAQRLGSGGAPQWSADGVAVCVNSGAQRRPVLVPDGSGGVIIAWYDSRGGTGNDNIYAQRVSPSGALLWNSAGVPVCAASGRQYDPVMSEDGSGGAIIVWQDARSIDSQVYTQRVTASGSVLWPTNGTQLCATTSHQTAATITGDGAGGVMVCWQDDRAGNADIYAQHVTSSGTIDETFTPTGRPICTALGSQTLGRVISVGLGVAVVAWSDDRNGAGTGDIYAQRISTNLVSTSTESRATPTFGLSAVGPNPSKAGVVIAYGVSKAEKVELLVFDARGRVVRKLASKQSVPSGRHSLWWDGRDDAGRRVSSGVYFVALQAGRLKDTRKVTILR